MTCLRGDFLRGALRVQLPGGPLTITTVRMLRREHARHESECAECAGRSWVDVGDISAVPPPYAVGMSCGFCHVRWRGCADVFECPMCGDGEPPWMPAETMEASW